MSLIDNYSTLCVLMERHRVSDGEGGWSTTWQDGEEFEAAIILDNSTNARIASKEGVTNLYTVTTKAGYNMAFHDVFRRKHDGQVFRVTSNADDVKTPDVASFQICQCSAEEWSLA